MPRSVRFFGPQNVLPFRINTYLVSKNMIEFPMLSECLGKWAFGNVHRAPATSRLYISSQISAGCLLARSFTLSGSPDPSLHDSLLADRQTWIQTLQKNQDVPYLMLVPLLKLLPNVGSPSHHAWMTLRGLLAKSCCEKVV
jgi:hypothetical protein